LCADIHHDDLSASHSCTGNPLVVQANENVTVHLALNEEEEYVCLMGLEVVTPEDNFQIEQLALRVKAVSVTNMDVLNLTMKAREEGML